MEYRVEELAAAAGVRVDTVRFYQGKGLLPAPRREGRVAIYEDRHLERLRRVRALLAEGFTLAQIGRLPDPAAAGHGGEALLEALVAETVGERTLSRSELAAESQVPDAVLGAACSAGLIAPIVVAGEERFSRADAEMARAGLEILGRGLPLPALLELAVDHSRGVESIADRAIELFDEHVINRAAAEAEEGAGDAIADAFRSLLPQVARLVALHFQRTLVNRALERLRGAGDREALERALEATQSARLEVSWRS